MRITGILLIMVMMTNTLDNIQAAQGPQNHKDNTKITNIQRSIMLKDVSYTRNTITSQSLMRL